MSSSISYLLRLNKAGFNKLRLLPLMSGFSYCCRPCHCDGCHTWTVSLKSLKSSVWLGPITVRQGMQNSSQATLLLLSSSLSSSLCFHSCCLDFSLSVGRPSLLLLVWIPDHWCPCCSLRFWACFLLGTLDTSLTFLPLLDFKDSGFVHDPIQHLRVLCLALV